MSPSRGMQLLIAHVRLGHRQTVLAHNAFTKLANRSFISSFSPLISLVWHDDWQNSINSNISCGSRSIHAQRQEAYGHPEWQSHTIDYSLFEEEDVTYIRQKEKDLQSRKPKKKPNQEKVNSILNYLISQNEFQQANNILREMKALNYPIKSSDQFAKAALEFANSGDWESCLRWLNLMPVKQLSEKMKSIKVHETQINQLSKIISLSTGPHGDSKIAWKLLVSLAKHGYLRFEEIKSATMYTMQWYLQHGSPGGSYTKQSDIGQWMLDLWIKLVLADANYHASSQRTKPVKEVKLKIRDDGNITFLAKTYNSCIRTLCRSGQVDKVLPWIKLGSSPEVRKGYHRNIRLAAKISTPTKRMITRLMETLPRQVRETLSEDISKINEKFLQQNTILSKGSPNRTEGFDFSEVLGLNDDSSKQKNTSYKTKISFLDDSLCKDIEKKEFMRGLQRYFENINDPHLSYLARTALSSDEYNSLHIEQMSKKEKYFSDQRTYALGLECILEILRLRLGQERRIALCSLYESWLTSIAYLQTQSEPSRASSTILNKVSEIINSEFITPLSNPTNGLMRPNASHFTLFMTKIVRSFSYAIPNGTSNSTNSSLMPDHGEALQWSIRIMADMQRFGQEPDSGPWQIFLECLGRGMKAESDEKGRALDRVKQALDILGMGHHDRTKQFLENNESNQDDRLSPFTYASFIRALLSVPPKRGGPLIEEAEIVEKWFKDDLNTQKQYRDEHKRYYRSVEDALELLQSCKEEQNLQHNQDLF